MTTKGEIRAPEAGAGPPCAEDSFSPRHHPKARQPSPRVILNEVKDLLFVLHHSEPLSRLGGSPTLFAFPSSNTSQAAENDASISDERNTVQVIENNQSRYALSVNLSKVRGMRNQCEKNVRPRAHFWATQPI
jgi:hypothetical protein